MAVFRKDPATLPDVIGAFVEAYEARRRRAEAVGYSEPRYGSAPDLESAERVDRFEGDEDTEAAGGRNSAQRDYGRGDYRGRGDGGRSYGSRDYGGRDYGGPDYEEARYGGRYRAYARPSGWSQEGGEGISSHGWSVGRRSGAQDAAPLRRSSEAGGYGAERDYGYDSRRFRAGGYRGGVGGAAHDGEPEALASAMRKLREQGQIGFSEFAGLLSQDPMEGAERVLNLVRSDEVTLDRLGDDRVVVRPGELAQEYPGGLAQE
jgi:hypothetical protein